MSPVVGASAPHELFVALVNLSLTPEQARGLAWAEALHRDRPDLAARARSLFPTPYHWVKPGAELFAMAAALGYLADTDTSRLLADLPLLPGRLLRLERPLPLGGYVDLTDWVTDRLEVLAADPARLADYCDLVRQVWEALRPEWAAKGLAANRTEASLFAGRLNAGEPLPDLLPPGHVGRLEQFRPAVDAYLAAGKVCVLPSYFARGSHAWAVNGTLYLGYGIQTQGLSQVETERAKLAAARLKALADPTRLRLLAYVGQISVTVSDLAAMLGVAQPTVSEHLRLLRDAGLVEMHREGTRVYYRTEAPAVEALLQLVRDIVIR